VMTTAEVQLIIDEMCPVDVAAGGTDGARPAGDRPKERVRAETDPPKRLYQISDGAMISGVCKGLAAYLHIDVTIVRVAFVVLAVLTISTAFRIYDAY